MTLQCRSLTYRGGGLFPQKSSEPILYGFWGGYQYYRISAPHRSVYTGISTSGNQAGVADIASDYDQSGDDTDDDIFATTVENRGGSPGEKAKSLKTWKMLKGV